VELAAFHGIIIQGLQLIVNWRSKFAIKFCLLVNRFPERSFEEGNRDALESRATAPDMESARSRVRRMRPEDAYWRGAMN